MRPYVAGVMNLLLLLSALFSALTGAGAGVRQPVVAQAVAVSRDAVRSAPAATRTIASRPLAAPPKLIASALPGIAAILALAAVEPLFASRRRE